MSEREVVCPYCDRQAELVGGDVIYPHRHDLAFKKFWLCTPCNAVYGNIEGYPGYRVGSDGSVWSCWNSRWGQTRKWRRLKTHSVHGYVQLSLSANKTARHHYVHHLVLTAFVGRRPEGMEGCHGDNDPSNNQLDNLRWDTSVANAADMVRAGNSTYGEKNPSAKLTAAEVVEIRRLRKAGVRRFVLAHQFNVREETISRITGGKIWTHLLVQSVPTAASQQS